MRNFLMSALVSLLFGVVAVAQDSSSGAPVQLPGLKAAARITRDSDGIAHIRAQNEHDLFFLQGYVHAEDRLFQMDVSRREASGTLAELLGPAEGKPARPVGRVTVSYRHEQPDGGIKNEHQRIGERCGSSSS